ncbi:glycosyltransferase, partial [Ruegeria aquimaris]
AAHYLLAGWKLGYDPSPDFSTTWYLEQNPDIARGDINPFVHWVLHGRAEQRPGCPKTTAAIDETQIDWSACLEEEHAAIRDWFDPEFYLEHHPDVAARGIDPAAHYLLAGWKLGYDPSPDFSTTWYLERYPDISRSKQNPFVHWCSWGRHELRETQSYVEKAQRDFRPRVSVIVPNYKHAPYLPQRIRSIAEQSYDNLEIIILDDCSPDNSQEVIRQTVAELGIDARLEFNEVNSGNVFAQWQKGLSLATGELIWICESDDYCAPDFLRHVVPAFADQAVNIAFGRIQFCDAAGDFMEGLDGYRESAEPGIWSKTLIRPAAQWFNGGFGVNNVIANVGGCVFRRMELPQHVWDTARTFRICGDWYLYIHIAGAGKIAYEPRSIAWFRQHGANTSASNFHQLYYYDENRRILEELVRHWGIASATRNNFLKKVAAQYYHFGLEETFGLFDELMQRDTLMAAKRKQLHVQLHFLGFHTGGGELFPINLANALAATGVTVSMLAVDMIQINSDMRAKLDPRIPVYHVQDMIRFGREAFLHNAGVSVINSHVAASDVSLAVLDDGPVEKPYVVTLHGSYVGLDEAPNGIVDWILRNVNQWIYTADRNLEFFETRDVDWDNFVKLPNAMPRDDRPAAFTREDLGIAEADVVFTMVARGVKRKGWRAAIHAFRHLREKRDLSNIHLLLVGEGQATETARKLAEDLEGVHFLGYQSEINGILRLSDCLLLPSRFEGESYPLCLIQALQEHVPAIATDIGEIRSMMTDEDGRVAGILLKNLRDSRAYFAELAQHMEDICETTLRKELAAIAAKRAPIFDMVQLAETYCDIFMQVQSDRCA